MTLNFSIYRKDTALCAAAPWMNKETNSEMLVSDVKLTCYLSGNSQSLCTYQKAFPTLGISCTSRNLCRVQWSKIRKENVKEQLLLMTVDRRLNTSVHIIDM